LRLVKGKDIDEEVVIDHLIANCSRDVFVYAHKIYNFYNGYVGIEEYETLVEDNGELIENIEVQEFVGYGHAWVDLGPITAEEVKVLSKFYSDPIFIESIALDDPV